MRLSRLLRLMKLGRIVRHLNEMIDSEDTSIIVHIMKMVVTLMIINHFVSCLWFLVSDTQDCPDTWVCLYGFKDEHWTYVYATSYHWAVSQFTPSSMHIQ